MLKMLNSRPHCISSWCHSKLNSYHLPLWTRHGWMPKAEWHRAAGSLGAAGPTQQGFLSREKKVIVLIFCIFCSFSNICAKAVQTDVCLGELTEDQQQADSSTRHRRRGSFTHQLVLRLVCTFVRGTAEAHSPMQNLTGGLAGLHLCHRDSGQVCRDFEHKPLVNIQSRENPWLKKLTSLNGFLLGSRLWMRFPIESWKLLL